MLLLVVSSSVVVGVWRDVETGDETTTEVGLLGSGVPTTLVAGSSGVGVGVEGVVGSAEFSSVVSVGVASGVVSGAVEGSSVGLPGLVGVNAVDVGSSASLVPGSTLPVGVEGVVGVSPGEVASEAEVVSSAGDVGVRTVLCSGVVATNEVSGEVGVTESTAVGVGVAVGVSDSSSVEDASGVLTGVVASVPV